jgi:hypothetical protein
MEEWSHSGNWQIAYLSSSLSSLSKSGCTCWSLTIFFSLLYLDHVNRQFVQSLLCIYRWQVWKLCNSVIFQGTSLHFIRSFYFNVLPQFYLYRSMTSELESLYRSELVLLDLADIQDAAAFSVMWMIVCCYMCFANMCLGVKLCWISMFRDVFYLEVVIERVGSGKFDQKNYRVTDRVRDNLIQIGSDFGSFGFGSDQILIIWYQIISSFGSGWISGRQTLIFFKNSF